MNLKRIDAAIAAYKTKSEDADAARLAFFREVWGVQDSVAAEAAALSYEAPAAEDLLAWYAASEPVLAHAPVSIDPETLADAIERTAACLLDSGGFPATVQEAFARTKWDRMVAASDVARAGSDPAAYVESFGELLRDDGMDEDPARVGALAASLALRALLGGPAAQVGSALRKAGAAEPHPMRCPVCGGAATVARVGDVQAVQGRGKELWCGQCGTAWDFERVRCARCGTQNQAHLHYFNVEGDDAHRIATCDECGGYVRTVYQEDVLAPFSFEVEDVVMARLDLIAYQQANAQAAGNR